MQYRIEGAWRETGADGILTIDAESEQDARAAANGMGLVVGRVGRAPSTTVHLSGTGALWGLCLAVMLLVLIVGGQSIVTWQREQEARRAMERASAEAAAALAEYESQIEAAAAEAARSLAAPEAPPVTEDERLATARAANLEIARQRVLDLIDRAEGLDRRDEWLLAIPVLTEALSLVEADPDGMFAEIVWRDLASAWQSTAEHGQTFSRPKAQAFDQAMRFYLRTQQHLDQRYGPLHELSVLHSDLVLLRINEYQSWFHGKVYVEDWINTHGILNVDGINALRVELRSDSRRRKIIEALLP